jgi:hypothetical protein
LGGREDEDKRMAKLEFFFLGTALSGHILIKIKTNTFIFWYMVMIPLGPHSV